jgi:hypothetical protein
MTVFKVENKDERGSLKCKFILSALLKNGGTYVTSSCGKTKNSTHLKQGSDESRQEDYLPQSQIFGSNRVQGVF